MGSRNFQKLILQGCCENLILSLINTVFDVDHICDSPKKGLSYEEKVSFIDSTTQCAMSKSLAEKSEMDIFLLNNLESFNPISIAAT